MTTQPILIDGAWAPASNPEATFQAKNPATGEDLEHIFPVSGWDDLKAMLDAAHHAVVDLRHTSPDAIADFLEAYAKQIESNSKAIIAAAHAETALPDGTRLPGELARTTGQLRQAAAATLASDPGSMPPSTPLAAFAPCWVHSEDPLSSSDRTTSR
jgi:alpha-ketoglutaric semialdehyde dehydrogenase